MTTAYDVIAQNSANAIKNPDYSSSTDKAWAQGYHSITNFNVLTTLGQDSILHSNLDTLLPLCDDDRTRLGEPAGFPNERYWRLETEADIENWWHTEVSNPVLSAWKRYPCIVQTSHTKPLTESNIAENIDCTYAMYMGKMRTAVIIGEIKRNLIDEPQWLTGSLREAQKKLARELRGYVVNDISCALSPELDSN